MPITESGQRSDFAVTYELDNTRVSRHLADTGDTRQTSREKFFRQRLKRVLGAEWKCRPQSRICSRKQGSKPRTKIEWVSLDLNESSGDNFHNRFGSAVPDDFHHLTFRDHVSLRNHVDDVIAELRFAPGTQL